MLTGISTASFFTKLHTESTFKYMKEFNAACTEVFFGCESEYYGCYSGAVIDGAISFGAPVHSVHGLTNQYEPELFSLNDRAVSDAEDVIYGIMCTAETMKAKNYTFHGPAKLKNKPYNHDFKRLSAVMNKIIERASSFGISVNYENVHWTYFSCPDYFKELKRECPKLGATLDIKQAIQSGYDYRDYFEVMKDRLKTVHVSDVDGEKRMLLPGRGTFDYVELYKRLIDVGFKGAVIMEVYPESYTDFNELKVAYEYLLECADKAGVTNEYEV